jgi:hypothetical protein
MLSEACCLRYAIALSRAVIRLLYRAAVFFLIMPHFAERSIREKVAGSTACAALASFFSIKRRTDRIWWRSRVLRRRFTSAFRLVWRTRFSEEIVFAML